MRNHSWLSKKQTIQIKAFIHARNVVSCSELMECPPGRFYLFCWMILVTENCLLYYFFQRGRKRTCFCVTLLSNKEFQQDSVIWVNVILIIAELHFSGLIGTTNHPDMQKIRIIGFFKNRLHFQFEFRLLLSTVGAPVSAVGRGIALQVGRSRVWFPTVSLEFFVDIILPAALWLWGWLSL
jgi:hypothetical protein